MNNTLVKIISNMKTVVVFAVIPFALHSCKNESKDKDDQENNKNYTMSNGIITLVEKSSIKSRLSLLKTSEESFNLELTTAGTVKSIPNNLAEIRVPFTGRILKSFVRLGQSVQPGSPLFEFSSPDYSTAQKEYFDSKQELKQAELTKKRQQDLFKHGVGVKSILEESNTEYEIKRSAMLNAAAALKIFNVNPEKASLGKPLVITSPIAGEVVINKMVIGNYSKEDAEPVAIVAELSKVWVVAQVKEKDIRFIHKLDHVEVNVDAFPDKKIIGKVYHINDIVNEETRSIEVLIECDNKNRDLKPGMYATVHLTDAPSSAILLPSKAVLQENNDEFVFVELGKNKYQKRKIVTQGTSDGKIVVKSGLKAGETIVSNGGIYLLEAK